MNAVSSALKLLMMITHQKPCLLLAPALSRKLKKYADPSVSVSMLQGFYATGVSARDYATVSAREDIIR